jgi:hypothetical protein
MDPFHVIFLFSLSPIIIFTDYTYKYMSKTASVLYEAGTAYPSRVSGFTPNFVGVHVHSQFCWGPCSLPVLLGSLFTPSCVGVRVHSQFCWGPCSLPLLLGFVFTPSFCWGSCSLPVFVGVRVAHHVSFRCCIFAFVFLRPVSCVLNVASVTGLSILD